MKLPFDFAAKFLLRLLLPGAIVTAIFWPLYLTVARCLRLFIDDNIAVPGLILVFGWMFLLLDMPIYMAMEGRRFWPGPVADWCRAREASRLARLVARRNALTGRPRTEISLEIRNFPLSREGIPEAAYPTRLGNLITASETYPDRKYGIDGAFAWYRLWIVIDKDLRSEIDTQQAIVDSALYSTVATLIGVPVCLAYASVATLSPESMPMLPQAYIVLIFSLICLFAAKLFYIAAIFAQISFGELFCSLFDQNLDKLKFETILRELADAMDEPNLASASQRVRARAAIRFLRWHKFRPYASTSNLDVREW